jgi:hypothetical protein
VTAFAIGVTTRNRLLTVRLEGEIERARKAKVGVITPGAPRSFHSLMDATDRVDLFGPPTMPAHQPSRGPRGHLHREPWCRLGRRRRARFW